MGHLLSSAIKMQGVAATTIEINNIFGVIVSWEKNGVGQGNVIGTLNATLTAGDTFMVTASNPFDEGANIDYYLNGSYVTSYFDLSIAQTPTITSAAGNAYKFDCSNGA